MCFSFVNYLAQLKFNNQKLGGNVVWNEKKSFMENSIGGKVLIFSHLNYFNNRFYYFKPLGGEEEITKKSWKSSKHPCRSRSASFVAPWTHH